MARDAESFVKPYVIRDGRGFKLKAHDPADTRWVKKKAQAKQLLAEGIPKLADLQERLYAQDKWGVLLMGDKNWKFSLADTKERERWDEYHEAYEDVIRHASAPHAPWVVVPADNKWFARIVVGAAAIASAMRELKLALPTVDASRKRELEAARIALERDGGARRKGKDK